MVDLLDYLILVANIIPTLFNFVVVFIVILGEISECIIILTVLARLCFPASSHPS